jgi:hypothetical protein
MNPPTEDKSGQEAENQTTQMALPGYASDKNQNNETTDYRHPQWHGDRYGKNKHAQPGCQHRQRTAQGKYSSRGADYYRVRRCQKIKVGKEHKEDIAYDSA